MSIMGRQIFSQLARLLFVETARDAYQLKNPGQNLPIVMVAGLGAASGVISVLFTAPIDLIKTRMQGLFWNKYRSPWQCARKLWVKEGPQVFFRGSAPRMVRVCIDMAYSATFYEFMCNYMEETWVEGAKRWIWFWVCLQIHIFCLNYKYYCYSVCGVGVMCGGWV